MNQKRKDRLQRDQSATKPQERVFTLLPLSRGKEMPIRPNRKARTVSIRKNKNMTTQIIDNHLGSCSVCNETVIATPMKADERVQIRNKK